MKRNRFAEMVPPTPDDFHASVLDALNRMETVRRRRQMQQRRIVYAAASLVAVVALAATLFATLQLRPDPQDAVLSPDEAMETVTPANNCAFTLDGWEAGAEGVTIDWTLESTYDEPVLYEYKVNFVRNGEVIRPYDYFETPDWPNSMGILSEPMLDRELNRKVEQSTYFYWTKETGEKLAGTQTEELIALISVSFYRPTAEFYADPMQKFENDPHWILQQYEMGPVAWAVNWSGNIDYQTPYGESSMTILNEYDNYKFENPAGSESECLKQMREYTNLRKLALNMYGYAEFLKSYEVRIDLTDADAVPVIEEVTA